MYTNSSHDLVELPREIRYYEQASNLPKASTMGFPLGAGVSKGNATNFLASGVKLIENDVHPNG